MDWGWVLKRKDVSGVLHSGRLWPFGAIDQMQALQIKVQKDWNARGSSQGRVLEPFYGDIGGDPQQRSPEQLQKHLVFIIIIMLSLPGLFILTLSWNLTLLQGLARRFITYCSLVSSWFFS